MEPLKIIRYVADTENVTPPAAERDFATVIDGVRSKDHGATTELWRTHNRVLVGWLGSLCGADAEDVAADAWIEALRGIDRFSGSEADFRTWLFTIARRRLIDRQRRGAKITFSALESTSEPESSSTEAPEATTIERADGEDAAAFIARTLSPDQAEVVLLRVISGLDVDQIAEVTGKKAVAVRVLCHRGLRKLAKVLGPDETPEKGAEQVEQKNVPRGVTR